MTISTLKHVKYRIKYTILRDVNGHHQVHSGMNKMKRKKEGGFILLLLNLFLYSYSYSLFSSSSSSSPSSSPPLFPLHSTPKPLELCHPSSPMLSDPSFHPYSRELHSSAPVSWLSGLPTTEVAFLGSQLEGNCGASQPFRELSG